MTMPKPTDVSLRELGGELMPNYIGIFVKDFDHKDAVTEHLNKWNTEIKKGNEAEQVSYSDTVAILMTLVRGMLDAVTYVLVAFTAISLVVSFTESVDSCSKPSQSINAPTKTSL